MTRSFVKIVFRSPAPRALLAGSLLLSIAGGCTVFPKQQPDPAPPAATVADSNVKIQPTRPQKPSAKVLTDFGFVEITLEHPEKAEVLFEQAIQRDSKHVMAYVGLAKVHAHKSRFGKAQEVLDRGLKKKPKSPELYNELAILRTRQKDYPGAVQAMVKAVNLAPENEEYRVNLAGMLAMSGRIDEAYQHYVKVLSPGEARYRIAGVLYSKGDRDGSLAQLEQGIKEQPGHAESVDMLQRLTGGGVQRVDYREPAPTRLSPPVPDR